MYTDQVRRPVLLGTHAYRPKLHEYPTFDGQVTSDHRHFMHRIDVMLHEQGVPEGEILSKSPQLFTDEAEQWYYDVRNDVAPASWEEWKVELVRSHGIFQWGAWIHDQIQTYRFPHAESRASVWISQFIKYCRCQDGRITNAKLQEKILRAIPEHLRNLIIGALGRQTAGVTAGDD